MTEKITDIMSGIVDKVKDLFNRKNELDEGPRGFGTGSGTFGRGGTHGRGGWGVRG